MSPSILTLARAANAAAGTLMLAVACLAASPAAADNPIHTNEAYIDEIRAAAGFDVAKIDEAFAYVFDQLPGEVTVYPTENYYYFKFIHGGVPYAGNFRLDVADRDTGVIHFAYFSENNGFDQQPVSGHLAYSAELGVGVKKTGDLDYAVTARGRTVVFHLNDLRGVRPAQGMMAAGEEFIGPVFDESGVPMLLMWNADLEMFVYVLDETSPAETYVESQVSSQIRLGLRTGFAWYRDRYLDRWILVGVAAAQTELNTYFDGPFDQLPDNFIEGEKLRAAFLALSPEVEGQIDRWGNSADLTGRMLADPYVLYSEESELSQFDQCAAAATDPASYYPCFAVGQTR
ncbi:hypothetical protein DFR52_104374 [Hoeflea marina]|uniref:Uncharacterized protein n=1 Tax=Hoeflea marina TaxID=274592 RepID=A0A317PHM3_9HYPH|nr:hypothetical protein [Hoeflea marina]PWV99082.1 hypothetical protein DFR52_104374 [Hoeflea marina]